MATNYVMFTTKLDPQSPDDVTIDVSTGATLVGASAVLNLNFDEDVFTSAAGRIKLINSVEHVLNKLKEPKTTWPLS